MLYMQSVNISQKKPPLTVFTCAQMNTKGADICSGPLQGGGGGGGQSWHMHAFFCLCVSILLTMVLSLQDVWRRLLLSTPQTLINTTPAGCWALFRGSQSYRLRHPSRVAGAEYNYTLWQVGFLHGLALAVVAVCIVRLLHATQCVSYYLICLRHWYRVM